ncbi:hypothetical protein FSP39_009991 [Pinctada imbricata]|uniref:T-cell activation inhibitor, mitochondrial n=1 Tax=Pinctada imbricata TaxID=66713 RepID=A0AA88XIB2_PINIB|nr:hypothetical protein FSP39_009991 [Pinctada imbricata]
MSSELCEVQYQPAVKCKKSICLSDTIPQPSYIRSGILRIRQVIICRNLSTSETSTALRPFYLIVHPDLFHQTPKERDVNEESLKKLHEYMRSLHEKGRAKPTQLKFYAHSDNSSKFTKVDFTLKSKNVRDTVLTVLKSCDLPLDYVTRIPEGPEKSPAGTRKDQGNSFYTGRQMSFDMQYYSHKLPNYSLMSFLDKFHKRAHEWNERNAVTQSQIKYLQEKIKSDIGLESLSWRSDWASLRFLPCLASFDRMVQQHKDYVIDVLKGRHLIFGDKTGVSFNGDVVINRSDAIDNWLKGLAIIPAYNNTLTRLPYMEWELSTLLANIKIVHRCTSVTHIVMADEYEMRLNRILNTLRRCQQEVDLRLQGKDLSNLEMVVESEAAPLTVSALGQFLTPCTIPGAILIQFVSKNTDEVENLLHEVRRLQEIEQDLHSDCIQRLKLNQLNKDDSISCAQMIKCCERLLYDAVFIESYLNGCNLKVTRYFSVLSDGEICIPWDWESDVS